MTTPTATTFECIDCCKQVSTDGAYTDPLGRDGDICGSCIEHLDAKNWTKDTILSHLFADDRGYYFTARTTKRDMVNDHHRRHVAAHEGRVNLAARAGIIDYLRSAFGCRVTDDNFSHADDEWIADHIRRHETGDDLGGRLL